MSDNKPNTPIEVAIKARGGQTGRVQLIAMCRRMAIEEGTTLEVLLWESVKGIARFAMQGDHHCAKLMLSLFARDDSNDIRAAEDAAAAETQGPPIPANQQGYAAEASRVIKELKLLG